MIHLILNSEFGDVTIVADDEQIKAHKYVLRFATFFDKFLKQKTHQNILIHLILNFELGDVTIVTDGEQIKALKYLLRFATFFGIFLKQKKITNKFSSI